MKKQFLLFCCTALFAAALIFAPPAQAAPSKKPWRMALITGGPFTDFQVVLQSLAQRLAELEIIADGGVPLPEDSECLAPMWQWLAENAGGDTLRFVPDAFYSPEWNPDLRAGVKENLLERLRENGDIDCILAFGTWAGQDIAPEPLHIPVLVLAAANAVEAGIIPSPDDSGRDNLLVAVEPGRYERQVRIFHQIIDFSRLGIVYEDTPSGRAGVALMEIEAAAEVAGVELLRCVNVNLYASAGLEAAMSQLRTCHADLVKQGADAVYITYQQGLTSERAAYVLEPLIKAGIPTFSQEGAHLVRQGVLLGMSGNSVREEGFFAAEALEKILNGSLPRSLSQRYESTTSLAVNLGTAARIGWNPPVEILAALDEYYRNF